MPAVRVRGLTVRDDSNALAPGPWVYVIDDEEGMRTLVVNAAEMAGYRCKAFADAESFYAALHQEVPKLIALDLAMPGTDGVEIIRELSSQACKAGLILISGFDKRLINSIAHLATSLELKLIGCLCKPFRINELFQLLALNEERCAQAPAIVTTHIFSNEELIDAIKKNQLLVKYQPQISLHNKDWIGVEALVRWQHPRHGLVSPDYFIPAMEQAGLMSELTDVVLRTTLIDLETLNNLNFKGNVSVNLPAGALGSVDFPDRVAKYIDRDDVPHGRITFELTETSIAENKTYAADILTRLRLKGFLLAIDDFGTGYSSLEALHKLPFNELKIDKHFVQSAETDAVASAIVEHSIALGKRLKMNVVAEGVENVNQLSWLSKLGCNNAQGYYVGRPVPVSELAGWLDEWNCKKDK